MGGMPISIGSPRREGLGPRVGGVADSDTPEDPAVEGRVSKLSTGDGGSLLGVGFLRVGTPSGQVHWASRWSDTSGTRRGERTYLALTVAAAHAGGLRLVALWGG